MDEAFQKILSSQQFQCFRCHNSLSIAPILQVENHVFCGRCKEAAYEENSNPKLERQVLFEKLAENFKFPCRYHSRGCGNLLLQWHEVEEHENNCKFAKMECFFNLEEETNCDWNGHHHEYFEHVKDSHTASFKIDNLDIWEDPKTQVYRVDFMDNILLVILLYFRNIYYFKLIGDDGKPPVQYNIEIIDETKRKSNGFSRFSTFLPCDMKRLKHGIQLKYIDLNPKYLSVYFGEKKARCLGKCDGKIFPLCDKCNQEIDLPVYTCENRHKFCEKCYGEDDKCAFVFKSKKTCGLKLSVNRLLEMQFMKEHYECYNGDCYFHGYFLEMKTHVQFCSMLRISNSTSRLNYQYKFSTEVLYFKFDHNIFSLYTYDTGSCLEFELSPYNILKVECEFEITIFNSQYKVLTIPIFSTLIDNLESSLNDKSRTSIPKQLINQDGSNNFTFQFNISKI